VRDSKHTFLNIPTGCDEIIIEKFTSYHKKDDIVVFLRIIILRKCQNDLESY